MAFDGITMHFVVRQLNDLLTNAKIDKISQAEKDEILLSLRTSNGTYKLLISASASLPRIYLTYNYKKENPLKAPNFLMVLRKYLQGGRIIAIRQDGFDRSVFIDVDTYDELKEQKTRTLIVEVMGRHSNIILVDQQSDKILDCAKKIPISISSYREVLPGITYKTPPKQEKLSPIDKISLEDFIKKVCTKMQIHKSLYTIFSGMSPLIAKEICYRSNIEPSLIANEISPIQIEKLYGVFTRLMNELADNNIQPCLVENEAGNIVDFSCIYLSMYEGYDIKEFDDISKVCDDFYYLRDVKDRINQKSHDVRKVVSNKISLLENKIEKQTAEINETSKAQDYKKEADLLTAYIYMIGENQEEIEVDDFYDENGGKRLIKLDKNLSPSENIQVLYKRYNKMKNRKKELALQMENAKEELDYLYNLELFIENASSQTELEDIVEEMVSQGVIRPRKSDNKKKKKTTDFSPMKFISDDGYEIFVGKNNNQNDYLTMKFAKSDDMWLHTKDIAGSHGIIKAQNGKVSDNAIKQTAIICSFYSKARFSQSVPVDYTQRKNVKKPNKAKPGMVIYLTNNTIYVTPDEKLVNRLKIED